MSGMMNGWMMGGAMLVSFVVLIGIITAIVLGSLWLVRRTSGSTDPTTKLVETPLEILKRRLAHGEITLEQFETLKHQVQEGRI